MKQNNASQQNKSLLLERWVGTVAILLFLIFEVVVPRGLYAEEERTPESLLRVIEQRSQELQKRLKGVSAKEQRLRLLEQELFQKLDEIKKIREEVTAKEKAIDIKLKAIEAKEKGLEKKAQALRKEEEAEKPRADVEVSKKQEEAPVSQKTTEKMKAKPSDEAKVKPSEKTPIQSSEELKAKRKEAMENRMAKAKAAADQRKMKAAAKKKKEKPLPPEKLEEMSAVAKEDAARKALEEKRYKDLAKVYEKMPPAEAALRLQNMNEVMALEIIPRMNKAKLARVLSSMDPTIAVRYTERIGMGGPFFPTDTPPKTDFSTGQTTTPEASSGKKGKST